MGRGVRLTTQAPTSAEVKNAWSYTSTLQCALMVRFLAQHPIQWVPVGSFHASESAGALG